MEAKNKFHGRQVALAMDLSSLVIKRIVDGDINVLGYAGKTTGNFNCLLIVSRHEYLRMLNIWLDIISQRSAKLDTIDGMLGAIATPYCYALDYKQEGPIRMLLGNKHKVTNAYRIYRFLDEIDFLDV